MNNDKKIILSAVIITVVVSLLFLIVPITGAFVVSYLFALIAISGVALSMFTFGKNETTKEPQGLSFIYTAGIYALIDVVFSVIACAIPLSAALTFVIHIAILAIFAIRAISLTSGSEYINKIDVKAEDKHKEFQKEKENYWR